MLLPKISNTVINARVFCVFLEGFDSFHRSQQVFQSCRDESSWVEPVLVTKQQIKSLAQGHNTVTPLVVRL